MKLPGFGTAENFLRLMRAEAGGFDQGMRRGIDKLGRKLTQVEASRVSSMLNERLLSDPEGEIKLMTEVYRLIAENKIEDAEAAVRLRGLETAAAILESVFGIREERN